MEFRRAAPHEAESLRFWNDSGASMGPTDEVTQLCQAIGSPATVLLLATADEAIVGTLLGAFDGWRGNVYRLVVHPDWRRQGIARQLVRGVEHVFAEWGVRRITVLIESDRPWAMSCWTALGYPRDDHIVRHVGAIGR